MTNEDFKDMVAYLVDATEEDFMSKAAEMGTNGQNMVYETFLYLRTKAIQYNANKKKKGVKKDFIAAYDGMETTWQAMEKHYYDIMEKKDKE